MQGISVIVPIFNCQNYMRRCIDSLLVQTVKDIEILLIDDGSEDDSGTICDEYALTDSRVRVIHKSNGGVCSARNAGLDNATGRYIMFCDSDDYVEPTWCEKLLAAIERNDGFFACCGYNSVSQSGKCLKAKVIPEVASEYSTMLVELYSGGLLPAVWDKIFCLEVITGNRIRFDEEISYAEDFIFVLQYLKTERHNLNVVPEALYNYVVDRPQSLTKKVVPNYWKLACRVFDETHQLMRAYGVDFSQYESVYYSGAITTIVQSLNMIFNYDISRHELFVCGKEILNSNECKAAFKYGVFTGVRPIYKLILRTRCFALVWLFHWSVRFKHHVVDRKL